MMRISRRLSNAIHPHFAFSRFRVFAVDFFGLTRWNPITMLKSRLSSFIVFFLAGAVFLVAPLGAQEKPPAARERQRALIETLRTGTAPQKALACKALAVYGDKEAVPALASLLTDGQLNSWARIALEAIDDPAAAQALREALGRVRGRQLVGVINSIGVKRDAAASFEMVYRLKDPDAEVASATAVTLGRIGGLTEGTVLAAALAKAPAAVVGSVAEGCILCAEKFLAEGNRGQAVRLYDLVRRSNAPQQRILEGVRGAILARGAAGIPLLVEQLRSPDKALRDIALSTSRELPGREATDALAAELGRAAPDLQVLLVLALADRDEPHALGAVLEAAKSGPLQVRLAAIRGLARHGNSSCIPVLLDIAAESTPGLSEPALAVLADLPDNEVDAAVIGRLNSADGKRRLVLVQLAGRRHIAAATPALLKAAGDTDAQLRLAALTALGAVVGPDDLPLLISRAVRPNDAPEAAVARAALRAAAIRMPDREACAEKLIAALAAAPGASKGPLIGILGAVGGAKSLEAVAAAAKDPDEAVREAAYRALGEWMSADAAPVLFALAGSPGNDSLQIRALRGYLRIARQFAASDAERLAMYRAALAAARRDDERRLAVEVLLRVRTPESLALAVGHLRDPALAETAGKVAVGIADKIVARHPAAVAQALPQVIAATKTKDLAA